MNTMHLIGSEDVARAGNTMRQVADEIQRAASSFEDSVQRMMRAMDEHAYRIKETMEAHAARIENAMKSEINNGI